MAPRVWVRAGIQAGAGIAHASRSIEDTCFYISSKGPFEALVQCLSERAASRVPGNSKASLSRFHSDQSAV